MQWKFVLWKKVLYSLLDWLSTQPLKNINHKQKFRVMNIIEINHAAVAKELSCCQHGLLKSKSKFFLMKNPHGFSLIEGRRLRRVIATGGEAFRSRLLADAA